jgi:hypothetical protein
MALGLIPLVDCETTETIARMLERVEDAPRSVIDALRSRVEAAWPVSPVEWSCAAETLATADTLAGGTEPDLLAVEQSSADLVLARNMAVALDGRQLEALVGRAEHDRDLAQAILARPEPSLWDRAALYRYADGEARRAIRAELASRIPGASVGQRLIEAGALFAMAESGDIDALLLALSAALDLGPDALLGLSEPADQELFCMALLAAGIAREDALRVLLTCGAPLSRSIDDIFRLNTLLGEVSPAVASHLVGHDGARARSARHVPVFDAAAGVRPAAATRRAAPSLRETRLRRA